MPRPRRGRPARAARPGPRPWGRLRPATERDLATLVRHRRAMFLELRRRSQHEMDRHDRVYRRWARRGMRAREFFAFVVEGPDGRIAGSGALWLQPQQPRPGRWMVDRLPYVLSMFTEPDARGRGVASQLVARMVDWATERGYPRIFLHASSMGRSVYERLGFESGNEMRRDLPRRRRRRR